MTGQPPAGSPQNADPWQAPAMRRRPGMVWFVMIWSVFSGLLEAFLAVALYAAVIRDDQVHEGSVPGGLWVYFVVLAVAAVLNVVLGVFIFGGARWAWTTAVVVVALILVGDAAAIVVARGAAAFIGVVRDIVALRVLLNRDVRQWCNPTRAVRDPGGRQWHPGTAR
jgi:hypothetical protein